MTKKYKFFLCAAIVGLTSMLFADEPQSLTKKATAGLIEDGLTDDLDVGVDGVKGLWFGGYNITDYNFDFGVGAYLGPLWISIFDEGTFSDSVTHEVSKKNDAFAEDGVNIDYIDVNNNDQTDVGAKNISNKLFTSFAVNKVGGQLYWYLDDVSSKASSWDKYTYTTETDTEKTDKQTQKKCNVANEFGAFFNGIKTPELTPLKLYFQLDQIGVFLKNIDSSTDTFVETKTTAKTTTEDHYTMSKNDTICPYGKFTVGFTFPTFGNTSTKFTVGDWFMYSIYSKDGSTTNKDVVDEIASTKTTTTDISYQYGNTNHLTNYVYPKFTTTYNLGESIKLKTAVAATVKTDVSPTVNSTKTTKTVVTDLDKTKNETTTTVKEETVVEGTFDQVKNSISTTLNPEVDLGFVYNVKPGKFDLMVGAKWYPGSFSWTTKSAKNEQITETSKETVTSSMGDTVVTKDTVTIKSKDGTGNNDSTAETASYAYSVSAATDDMLYVGCALYFTENVKMEMLYTSGFNTFSLMSGLLDSSLTVDFTVKF